MAEELILTSTQNPKIKRILALRDKRDRDESGLFLIEGYRETRRAADAGTLIEELFICPDLFLGENELKLIMDIRKSGGKIVHTSDKVFQKISYRDRPDGLLAVARQMRRSLHELPKTKNPFYCIAEAIEKPGNLGTILRSADAVGVDGVIVCDRCTDVYNPNVVRASVGTLFTIPVVEAGGAETLLWLRERGVKVLAATPHAKQEYNDVDLTGPIAIVVGAEQVGLSDPWMSTADIQVKIPMLGVADSLNVAMATTILLYEVLRQRRRSERPLL